MNAERLHAIALTLREELAETEVVRLLTELADHLEASASDPANAQNQVVASQARRDLVGLLRTAPSNRFSGAWRQTLDEIGVSDSFGDALAERVDSIIAREEITLGAAAEEIRAIAGAVLGLSTRLDGLVETFAYLLVGAEELERGEFEIEFLVPRAAVRNELMELGIEIVRLEKILWPFFELATGTHPPIEVRTISSSGFQIFVATMASSAYIFSKAIANLVDSYEKVRRLRSTAESMESDGVPTDLVQRLKQHATQTIEADITLIAERLVEEHPEHVADDPERRAEVTTHVKVSLRAIAERIDKEYGFDVRHGQLPLAAEEGSDEEPVPEDVVKAAVEIDARRDRIRFMNLTGIPILELPRAADDEVDPSGPLDS